MSYSNDLKEYIYRIPEKKDCCKKAFKNGLKLNNIEYECERDIAVYLRGAFIKCGHMTDPKKQYHIYFSAEKEQLDILKMIIEAAGITVKYSIRRGKEILYIRDSEQIEGFLTTIGASAQALNIMEDKVIKEIRLNINRKQNAEVANMEKTSIASVEQRNAIELLKLNKEFESLSAELKETANIRLEYPDDTLEQLRKRFEKPISKSGLSHRLKKIIEEAKRFE
ncbi:DNA-binding protein WhiA [Eubacteriales bacterium OttesenSCG-928-G02]|nr:DNA-binding protein WhiA [Eubacteriales bacterium OttesenSCG-928-G02]